MLQGKKETGIERWNSGQIWSCLLSELQKLSFTTLRRIRLKRNVSRDSRYPGTNVYQSVRLLEIKNVQDKVIGYIRWRSEGKHSLG